LEALLLTLDVVVVILLCRAVKRRETAKGSAAADDMGIFSYRDDQSLPARDSSMQDRA
jgi:hypothetical protein